MAAFSIFKLSLLLSLLSNSHHLGLWSGASNRESVGISPPSCSRIECPSYDVVHVGNGFEIRRYNSTVWMSTSPIQDISLVEATRTGFLQLFDYIQGKNDYEQKIEMTAPVITEVSPSDGPLCESSFVISFSVPKLNQANPPPAKGLHLQRWEPVYAAVRQFSGFVADSDVGEEAAALQASLAGTVWSAAIEKSHGADHSSGYTVAQYNSPFEFDDRVNEIWMLFNIQDELTLM
ncbi:heme-binding protein 2-like [Juglans microcarpa x Juglans regia]|uniref:heme-binding protein 2-like n=1 Tax=Juglans microcarpa x Juglans regia TaxID=2249226 RepID=UPI001B7F2F7E|nr:heme-binding protein 2-like [Juglans microcarpa x Juglans regia]